MKTIVRNYNGTKILDKYESTDLEKRIVDLYKDSNNIDDEIKIFSITDNNGKFSINIFGSNDFIFYTLIDGIFINKETCLKYLESSVINEVKDILRAAKRLEKYNVNENNSSKF